MRILLLGFTKMKFMPYSSFYLDKIDYTKNAVEMVYWNRDSQTEDLSKYDKSIVFHEFQDEMADSIMKRFKIRHFYKYRRFVSNLLSQKHFDVIICLHTLPGLLILDKLVRHYSGKYILDYRDSTFENNRYFGKLIRILAQYAKLVFVSSDAFRCFLPKNNVEMITSHNILVDSLLHRDERLTGYIRADRIRVAFWGLIRHYDHNEKIISRLGNDTRFELHYYGREEETGKRIRQYIAMHNISNVFLHGEYRPEDRYDFVKQTDILHNSYNDANMLLAMGNKYYDGIIFRIPQLCMAGSYMAKRSQEKGVGFALDPDDIDYADSLFNAYHQLNQQTFNDNCDKELDVIISEYEYGSHRVAELLNNESLS